VGWGSLAWGLRKGSKAGGSLECSSKMSGPDSKQAVRPGVFVRCRLLFADERTVYIDVIQHDQAGPGFRSTVENKVDALNLASGLDDR